jgi:hypothetical protein
MISYLHTIASKEDKKPIPIKDIQKKITPDTFSQKFFPLINDGFTVGAEELLSFLRYDENLSMSLHDISHLLLSIDIRKLILEAKIIRHGTINPDKESLRKQYLKYTVETRNRFPYFIYSCQFSSEIDDLFGFLKKTMNNLNYVAFVSKNKYDIDETIKSIKDNLYSNLFWSMGCSGYKKDINIEDAIHIHSSPFAIHYGDNLTNNPFRNSDQYLEYLLTPYIYKLNRLENAKEIFNSKENILLSIFLGNGLLGLQKKVLTYRSYDIIVLFLLCLYITYLLIEHVLMYNQELYDVAYFIYEEIENDDYYGTQVYIPPSIHDMFRLHELDEYSTEADTMQFKQDNVALQDIDESYKRRFSQLQKAYINIFKVGVSKILSKKNSLFFKKYYGRIPHLLKQYGSISTVVENTMVDDPGQILSGSCVDYVEKMTADSTNLFNELLKLAQVITSTPNIDGKINVVKRYCKQFPIEDANPGDVKEKILSETRYRIAASILQDNEIYGFTVDGILQNKKFPPANHIVTSLFVKNPHEKPTEQSVNEIFSNEKSLLMFAHPENIIKFNNLYKTSASKIINTFNPKVASNTEKNLEKATRKYSYQLMNNAADEMHPNEEIDPKEQKKISDKIEKAIVHAMDMVIDQKRRCLQCAGIAHDMIGRVTDLAKRCIVAMLNTEKQKMDTDNKNRQYYKSGNKVTDHKSITRQLERNEAHIKDRQQNNY